MSSSYISRKVSGLPPSGIRKFFDIQATMPDVISLGIGEPDFVTPQPIMQAGIDSLRAGQTQYTSNSGTIELREALANHLSRLYQVNYDPATEIVVTIGVSEALGLAMTALIDPGDEVIIPTPCFVSYQGVVLIAGGVPVEVPSKLENDFQPDVMAVEAAVTPRTKAILIGYPSNPSGAVASREVLMEIGRIAEKHDLVVISDEIYDQLVYGVPHVCFASLPRMRERTIMLSGFSKDYAMTGWRVGFAAAPQELLQAMLRVHQYSIMCAPTMSQAAALEALRNGEEHVETMCEEYDRRRRLIVVTGTGLDDETFAHKLLESEQVAVVPGSVFGPGGEGFVRCSYATAYEQIEQALDRIARFIGNI
jgi:aminotransferase